MIDDTNEKDEEKAFAIAMISEDGNINWVISENISLQQEKMFRKIYAVTVKPSLVLLLFLHLEILLLNIIIYFENFLKGKDKNND